MGNMSYCRFENTYSDLNDCVSALIECVEDEELLSSREDSYAAMMRDLCEDYLEAYQEYIDMQN